MGDRQICIGIEKKVRSKSGSYNNNDSDNDDDDGIVDNDYDDNCANINCITA